MHKDGAYDVSISSKHFGELHDDFVANQCWLTTSRCVSDGAVWQYFGSASFSLLHLKAKCYEGKLGLKKLKLGWKGRWADSLVMAILQRSVNIGINWVKLQQDKVWLLVSTSKLLPKNTVALLSWAQHFCQTCTKMSQKEATFSQQNCQTLFSA